MVGSIGTSNINPVQMFNAMNAFKQVQAKPQEQMIPEVSDGINLNEIDLLQNQDLNEIKQIAKNVGEDSISDDDIRYGVTYGRSVIADYSA